MKKKFTTIIISILAVCLIVGLGLWGFTAYKKHDTKQAVEEYLHNKGIDENKITSIEPFIADLRGDKNYMVSVKLKNDDRTYYYYKDRSQNKVVFESFVLNQKTYSPDELDE